jgi:hypothetical protein
MPYLLITSCIESSLSFFLINIEKTKFKEKEAKSDRMPSFLDIFIQLSYDIIYEVNRLNNLSS